jgi:hypothetical protein
VVAPGHQENNFVFIKFCVHFNIPIPVNLKRRYLKCIQNNHYAEQITKVNFYIKEKKELHTMQSLAISRNSWSSLCKGSRKTKLRSLMFTTNTNQWLENKVGKKLKIENNKQSNYFNHLKLTWSIEYGNI